MFIDIRSAQKEVSMIVSETKVVQSNLVLRTPALYGHLIITDSLLCPLGQKAVIFYLNSTPY